MSVNLPFQLTIDLAIIITKCESSINGTDIECTLDGVPCEPFSLPQDVAVVGLDKLLPAIRGMVGDQINAAMRLAQ